MAVVVVNELKKIVQKVSLKLYGDATTINFIHGNDSQTVKKLKDLDKDVRYPCIAVLQPFNEFTGDDYLNVTIGRLIIATVTDSTLPPDARYSITFIPVLYRIYDELMNQFARSAAIVGNHPQMFVSRKQDVPGSVPAAEDLKDYLDTIELYDLKLDFEQ